MTRFVITFATFVSVAVTPTPVGDGHDHHARKCRGHWCAERAAMRRCSQARVIPCIHRAAIHHGVSFATLRRRAWCESRFNPYAWNGAHAGLFQFRTARPSTWATVPRRYARHSPYSAKWSSLAAAWMERVGRGREWACR